MSFSYPYDLIPQPEGGFTVTFPDVPEAITQGETEEEAAQMAEDALVTALSFYTDDAEPLPLPSPAAGRKIARVPPLVAAKLMLHDAMITAGVSNVDLARQLGVDEKIVRRLRNPLYKSLIDRVDKALRSLGKRIEIIVGDTEHDTIVSDNILTFERAQKRQQERVASAQKLRDSVDTQHHAVVPDNIVSFERAQRRRQKRRVAGLQAVGD